MNLQNDCRDGNDKAQKTRVLFVDDNDDFREVIRSGLEHRGFEVTAAASVNEALKLIVSEAFDVLISDLHMPDAGDGFTVVTAMRHSNPKAVTIVLSGYPEIQESISAILFQADEILMKPVGLKAIVEIIQKRISNPSNCEIARKERVADILERSIDETIQDWVSRMDDDIELKVISLPLEKRMGHLPLLIANLVERLRATPNSKAPVSSAAHEHGILRRRQGYTVPMVVEESRILQVSIFNTLQKNIQHVEISSVLVDIMTIADEVDSQLKQAMVGFMESIAPPSMAR